MPGLVVVAVIDAPNMGRVLDDLTLLVDAATPEDIDQQVLYVPRQAASTESDQSENPHQRRVSWQRRPEVPTPDHAHSSARGRLRPYAAISHRSPVRWTRSKGAIEGASWPCRSSSSSSSR